MSAVPSIRITRLNAGDVPESPRYVLYWMIAARRGSNNFALDRAIELCREHKLPLLVLEPLRCGYQWASDRLHAFVLQGMAANAKAFAKKKGIHYYPYVEPKPGAGKGLLAKLSKHAAAVVTDEFPYFFLPGMVKAAARQIGVPFEVVDSNGLLPLRACEGKAFTVAHSFRRFLHKKLLAHLNHRPNAEPLRGVRLPEFGSLPAEVTKRWPPATNAMLSGSEQYLSALPIDHSVVPVPHCPGGSEAARARLNEFLEHKLEGYSETRNHPSQDSTTWLAPHLHFGHISTHEIFAALESREEWSADLVNPKKVAKREGWWGMSADAEAMLDQLVTWRELGFNNCFLLDDLDRVESLADWTRATIRKHAQDKREWIYSREQFESASTHDEIWNAAQRQLVAEGRIHNVLRMIWGKKIFEWSPDAQAALDIMFYLNNKYALDGRDPNSMSGITWCLGRFDRAWGPERKVYGTIRYMSSDRMAKKTDLSGYLTNWGKK